MRNINSKILLGVIVLVVLLGGVYYLMQKQYQPVVSPSVNNVTPSASSTATNMITIQNFSFNPGTITVKTGTTVTWTNQDAVTHRIKSDTFNSADLNQGDSFSFTFSQAGSFDYTCGIHPYMSGKIVVQ